MIPTTGWLLEADNTLLSSVPAVLPVANTISYGDGVQGSYEEDTLQDPTFNYRLVTLGSVSPQATAGLIGVDFGFLVTLAQLDVYGVMLIDMLDPPEPIAVVEVADTPVVVVEPCPDDLDILATEACCELQ